MNHNNYDMEFEYEGFEFPVKIYNISFENNYYKLDDIAVITISRDKEYKLTGAIEGYTKHQNLHGFDASEEGPGNFAALDTIHGTTLDKQYHYTLSECVIGDSNIQMKYNENKGMPFTAKLHLESIICSSINKKEETLTIHIEYDWFICSKVHLFYTGQTSRFYKEGFQKIRLGIDQEPELEKFYSRSLNNDFFILETFDFKCIVSTIPKELKLKWADGFCIEYRSQFGAIPTTEFKKSIQCYVGFILGTEFIYIGSTKIRNYKISELKAINPVETNISLKCQNAAQPPTKFNGPKSPGSIQEFVNQTFPEFLKLKDQLCLDDVLWRYFKMRNFTIGVNLPILSSALDLLVFKYLKNVKNVKETYIDEKQFNELLSEEFNLIKSKLSTVNNGDKILKKILSSNKLGISEKYEIFFDLIKLPIGQQENKALQLRNSMAHGGGSAKDKEEAKQLILHTYVYESLFHRIILKLLSWDKNYIDYYYSHDKVKPINTPSGPS